MDKFGWAAKDNTGAVWRHSDFVEYPGAPTAWSQFVAMLEEHDRFLTHLILKYGSLSFSLPAYAEQYGIHYNMEVELGAQNTSKYSIVATALKDKIATVRTIDDEGGTTLTSQYMKNVELMRPSPLARTN